MRMNFEACADVVKNIRHFVKNTSHVFQNIRHIF